MIYRTVGRRVSKTALHGVIPLAGNVFQRVPCVEERLLLLGSELVARLRLHPGRARSALHQAAMLGREVEQSSGVCRTSEK